MGMPERELYKTVRDVLALPEGQRAELIDGVIYDLAAPSREHQRISMTLASTIYNRVQNREKGCEVYPAPFAVYLKDDEYNYVEPDISVICDQDKLKEDGCHGAPDWIIEIVSPASRRVDYLLKTAKYEAAGVRLYWIVDPAEKLITVNDFEHGEISHYRMGEPVPVPLDPGWSITIAE